MTVHTIARRAAAATLAVSAFGLAGCSDDTAETVTDAAVEDIQENVGLYAGLEVTVAAEVGDILSPTAFTITGTEDPENQELLVVSATEWSDLEPSMPVQVRGEVQTAFVLVALEEELGQDLNDDLYAAWEGLPYIVSDPRGAG